MSDVTIFAEVDAKSSYSHLVMDSGGTRCIEDWRLSAKIESGRAAATGPSFNDYCFELGPGVRLPFNRICAKVCYDDAAFAGREFCDD